MEKEAEKKQLKIEDSPTIIKKAKTHKKGKKHKKKIKYTKVFGKKIPRDRFMLYATNIFFIVLIIAAGIYYQFFLMKDNLTQDDAKSTAETFINENLLAPGMTASIKDISSESCLYKMKVDIGNGQEVDSYMTKEGKTFFTNAIDIEDFESQNEDQPETQEQTEVEKKSEKPNVELFVMSHCPYGTQMEKGILPVVETLSDKIDFQLKFVDYAMHDKKEIDEQLNQYCIQKNEPDKLMDYVKCFLEEDSEGQSAKCVNDLDIDSDKLSSCVSETDNEFQITQKYEDKDNWNGTYPPFDVHKDENDKYDVTGSPTLIVNETKISSGRDSASLLATICSGFNEKPSECDTELSSENPSPGFGFGTTTDSSAGSCN